MTNSRSRNRSKSTSTTYNRWGDLVARGAVVRVVGGGGRGVVLRLKPLNDFSRAYGRQAVVQTYDNGRVYESEYGINDLKVLGFVKRMPKTGTVTIPPSAEEMERWQKMRDIRREGQGSSYDPKASYNAWAEKPPAGRTEERVVRSRRKRSRARSRR